MEKIDKKSSLGELGAFIMLTLGVILAAVAIEAFLVPNLILDGGVTGISIMLSTVTKLPLSVFIIILNIPFLIIGYRNLGTNFLIRAMYSMIAFSLLLSLFHNIPEMTDDVLLATVFGGILLGVGAGLVVRYGGCLDGTESLAIVLSKKTSLSVGQIVLIFNLFIYTTAGFIFGMDRALYSLLTYFITFKVIDFVSEGLEQAKAAMIITDKGDKISKEIYERLGRTVTELQGKGLISGKKVVLYSVITRLEVPELKRIVTNEDTSAFVTITDVSEIIGRHIKSNKKQKDIVYKKKIWYNLFKDKELEE